MKKINSLLNSLPLQGKEAAKKYGFTLVELIVVITILAILGTIAFISLQGYSKDARDSVRISDISKIKTSLELFQLDAGKYPETTDSTNITYSGAIAWTQGTFGETTYSNVEKLDKIPTDPVTDRKYVYSVTNTKQEYQIAGVMEGDEVTMNINQTKLNTNQPHPSPLLRGEGIEGILETNAAGRTAMLKISGNYNGKVLKVNTGGTDYVLAVPSIITSSGFILDEIVANNYLAYNGYKNLPAQYAGSSYDLLGEENLNLVNNADLVIYSGDLKTLSSTEPEGILARKNFLEKVQLAYSGTKIDSIGEISEILNASNDEDKEKISIYLVKNLLGGILSTGLGGGTGGIGNGDNSLGSTSCTDFIKVLGGTGIDYILSSIIDESGNIYVAGYYYNNSANANGVFDFDGNNLLGMSSTQSNDSFVAKFDSNGNQLWIKTLGGKLEDSAYKVVNSNDGGIYVGGIFINNSTDINGVKDFDGAVLYGKTTNSTLYDAYVAKLDSNGNQLWIKTLGGTGFDQVKTLTSDSSGNVYIGGDYVNNNTNTSTVKDFAGSSLYGKYNLIGSDGFITKLNSSGTQQWIKTFGGDGSQNVYSLQIDSVGNLYAGGLYANTKNNVNLVVDFLGNPIYGKSLSSLTNDGYIVKLDNNGIQQWIKTFGGTGNDYVNSVSLNNSGDIFIGGTVGNNDINTGLTTDFLGNILLGKSSVKYNDGLVVKMDSTGNQQWIKVFGGTGDERISMVKSDNYGNVYVVANYYNDIDNTKFVYDFADNILLGKPGNVSTSTDTLFAKIDSDGNQLLIKTLGGTSIDSISTISSDNNGKVYVGGSISNTIDNNNNVTCFDGETTISGKSSTNSYDAFIVIVGE